MAASDGWGGRDCELGGGCDFLRWVVAALTSSTTPPSAGGGAKGSGHGPVYCLSPAMISGALHSGVPTSVCATTPPAFSPQQNEVTTHPVQKRAILVLCFGDGATAVSSVLTLTRVSSLRMGEPQREAQTMVAKLATLSWLSNTRAVPKSLTLTSNDWVHCTAAPRRGPQEGRRVGKNKSNTRRGRRCDGECQIPPTWPCRRGLFLVVVSVDSPWGSARPCTSPW